MPPQNINYANNCIYKIVCKDDNIKDLYVGRTCDPVRRKSAHKSSCKNKKDEFLYHFINENGGWDNWDFIIIEKNPCLNSVDAGKREEYWICELMASLNCHYIFGVCVTGDRQYKKEWYFKNQKRIQDYRNLKKQKMEKILNNQL